MKKFVLLLLALATINLYAEPTCVVTVSDGNYEGIVASGETRIVDTSFTLPVPEKLALEKDAYYASCVIYEDHKPVKNTLVRMTGLDWEVDVNTTEYGCWYAMLPSDNNFTLKIINPKTTEWAVFEGTLVTLGVGTLNTGEHIMPEGSTTFPDTSLFPVGDLIKTATMVADTLVTAFERTSTNSFKWTPTEASAPYQGIMVTADTIPGTSYTLTVNISKEVSIYFTDVATNVSLRTAAILTKTDFTMPMDTWTAIGDKTEFWDNFRFLLKHSIAFNLYKYRRTRLF